MNNPYLYLAIGLGMGILKVLLEYDAYKSKKGVNHFVGLSGVIIVLALVFCFSHYNFGLTAITWLTYWNIFELLNNWSHSQAIFYVGTAPFDKLLRKYFTYPEKLKFILHIITIVIVILLIYFNHE